MTAERGQRPASVVLLVAAMAFQALSALAGGGAMLAAPHGSAAFPTSLLAGSPFDTFLIPALLLFGVLGLVPAGVTWALLTRPRWRLLAPIERSFGTHWAWPAAGAVGVALLVFLGVEAAMLGVHWLQALYAAVGAALVGLTVWPDTRRYYRR